MPSQLLRTVWQVHAGATGRGGLCGQPAAGAGLSGGSATRCVGALAWPVAGAPLRAVAGVAARESGGGQSGLRLALAPPNGADRGRQRRGRTPGSSCSRAGGWGAALPRVGRGVWPTGGVCVCSSRWMLSAHSAASAASAAAHSEHGRERNRGGHSAATAAAPARIAAATAATSATAAAEAAAETAAETAAARLNFLYPIDGGS